MTAINRNALGLSRQAVALRLLAHGALTGTEFADITGWPRKRSHSVLGELRESGAVQVCHVQSKRQYQLTRPVVWV